MRPYLSLSIDQLEVEYERLVSRQDRAALKKLAEELGFRRMPRAKELRQTIEQALQTKDQAVQRRSVPGRPAERQKARNRLPPTDEQMSALDGFASGASLKINAFAGTGKTSTLEMLAQAANRRGQYIAFNRAIVKEAKERFPDRVVCSTSHGLAYRAVAPMFGGRGAKLTERFNANHLAELLKLKKWRASPQHMLAPRTQGYLILNTIRRYAQSADKEIAPTHVPTHGSLLTASDAVLEQVRAFAVQGARNVWERMTDVKDPLPLGHDGYLKLWSLSEPTIPGDYILLDEAQDTNPVVLDVLARQQSQLVYVGDQYQQIYEWRGAVNAMEAMPAERTTYLTTSFRFGSPFAELASNVLQALGEQRPLRGNPQRESRFGSIKPRTKLARTNAATITAVIEALDSNAKPHLVGGIDELMTMLRGVQDLKNNQPSTVPDFFGFNSWAEVIEFTRSGEGEHLQTFVNLVETRGERQLMWALQRTVDEDKCDVVVSTAHKAKGREWSSVALMDDFLKSQNAKANSAEERKRQTAAELRLLYVALTRAKEELVVPEELLENLQAKADYSRDITQERKASPMLGNTASIDTINRSSRPRSRSTLSAPIAVQRPIESRSAPQTFDAPASTERRGFWARIFGSGK